MASSDPPVLVPEEQAELPKDSKKTAGEPVLEASTNGKKYASREDFLAAAGHLAEEELFIDGIGLLLCSEISGDARADIVGQSATSLQAGKLDVKTYQRQILLAGLVDSNTGSPGERQPLFRPGDIDRVMKVGGKKILEAVDVVERLSAMGRYQELAEENLGATPSDASTLG